MRNSKLSNSSSQYIRRPLGLVNDDELFNYLLLKRPPYWPPIVTFLPSIDIQLLLQQKCCVNSLLSSIWPLSGPLVTLIWALVSTNTLTMTKRMRGTSKTVRSVHTEQTYDHTVHTEWTYVCSVATVQTHVCAGTMTWTYYVSCYTVLIP